MVWRIIGYVLVFTNLGLVRTLLRESARCHVFFCPNRQLNLWKKNKAMLVGLITIVNFVSVSGGRRRRWYRVDLSERVNSILTIHNNGDWHYDLKKSGLTTTLLDDDKDKSSHNTIAETNVVEAATTVNINQLDNKKDVIIVNWSISEDIPVPFALNRLHSDGGGCGGILPNTTMIDLMSSIVQNQCMRWEDIIIQTCTKAKAKQAENEQKKVEKGLVLVSPSPSQQSLLFTTSSITNYYQWIGKSLVFLFEASLLLEEEMQHEVMEEIRILMVIGIQRLRGIIKYPSTIMIENIPSTTTTED